jgi:hypothetical protein
MYRAETTHFPFDDDFDATLPKLKPEKQPKKERGSGNSIGARMLQSLSPSQGSTSSNK